MNTYNCTQCGKGCKLSTWELARWHEPTMHKCPHCGMVHAVQKGHAPHAISPRMLPFGVGGRTSPWQLPWSRPVSAGMYECRFTTRADVLLLYWSGERFLVGVGGQPVRMGEFLSWRGTWE